jgi:1-phosphofructokinase
MIVTLTANPSIDRTVSLTGPLRRGAVHRATAATSHPGGKGVNVARVITAAGKRSVAVLPGNTGDPILLALAEAGIDHRGIAHPGTARVNLTVTEPDGTTTKINEPGAALPPDSLSALASCLQDLAASAVWVVLSGSLPPGVPAHWYADLVTALRAGPTQIAVDTSDEPLLALAAAFPGAAPDLIKPNAAELGQLTGVDGADLERAAERGDPLPTARAARSLIDGGGPRAVLATLGAAGAVLVTDGGAWYATTPPIAPRSTVGAGDASLAGYLLADLQNAGPADRLARAVAYGSAAAALPGTALPSPHHTHPGAVTVTALNPVIGNH